MNLYDYFKKLTKVRENMRVLLMTHTDMDGAGPAILFKVVFGDRVDVVHCSTGKMSAEIRNRVTDPETAAEYDLVITADISCSEEDAKIIDRYKKVDLVILDHHGTAEGLNCYPWACVHPELLEGSYRDVVLYGTNAKPVHSSGTSLAYDYLEYCGLTKKIVNREMAKYLVFLIAGYDTWDWFSAFGRDSRFDNLQRLFSQYGISEFENEFTARLMDPRGGKLFNETDRLLLRIAESKRKYFLEEVVASRIRTGNILLGEKYYSFTYCSGGENMASVFEYMRDNYDVDLHIVDYGSGISIRSDKDDINVGELTKNFGGGGHPGAGGFKIPLEKRKELLMKMMNTSLMVFD